FQVSMPSCSGVGATVVPPLSRGIRYLYRRLGGGAEVPPPSRHRGVSQLMAGVAWSDRAKLLALYHSLPRGMQGFGNGPEPGLVPVLLSFV
ncbi:hypothetical protein BHM03_00054944, partial [Ensete ventricosum]